MEYSRVNAGDVKDEVKTRPQTKWWGGIGRAFGGIVSPNYK